MLNNRSIAVLSLFGVTLLWGGTFVWMQQSLDAAASLSPNLPENHVAIFFVMMRFVIAGFFLLILIPKTWSGLKEIEVWKGGLILGIIVWGGFILQMLGLTDVTPAVSAFLTSLYVVFTALIGVAMGVQKLTRFAIAGVILATFGAGWISGPPQLNFGIGEWLTVGCALLFGAHIIATDRVTKAVDPIQVTATMLLTVAALSTLVYLLTEIRTSTCVHAEKLQLAGHVNKPQFYHRKDAYPTTSSSYYCIVCWLCWLKFFMCT